MEKNALHTELTLWKDAETFTVTRQVDHDIANKIDRKAFREAALSIGLPKLIIDLDFIFITLICQATDEGKNEIWEHEGGAYMTLVIPYELAKQVSTSAELLQELINVYQDLVLTTRVVPSISNLDEG